jgi:hypothetical protein
MFASTTWATPISLNLEAESALRVSAETDHPSAKAREARAEPKYPHPSMVIEELIDWDLLRFYLKSQD